MYEKYLKFALEVASHAGKMMRAGFSLEITPEWKSDNTPLTETDSAINQMVLEQVALKFPGHAVLGEESSTQEINTEYVWVCDPIDGTLVFSHGLNISTFSLALVRDGKPVVAIVLDPFQKLLYQATIDGTTKLNGQVTHVNQIANLNQKIVSVEAIGPKVEVLKSIKAQGGYCFSCTSFIFGAKMVASGHFSAAIFAKSNPWDVAAIKLIVEQAGGKTSDLEGNTQDYNKPTKGFLASNGLVHEQLLKILQEHKLIAT